MDKSTPLTVTPNELAALLNRSPVTLERWRRLRRGPPHFYAVGNRPLYLLADVEAWLSSQREKTGRDNDGPASKRRKGLRS